jgi:nicotinate-nucleotide pyrophosphorylase (carboxylating)
VKPGYITDKYLSEFITSAFREDVGDGDHSTLASIPEEARSAAQLLVKDNGILAGVEIAEKIFHHFDPSLKLNIILKDGARIKRRCGVHSFRISKINLNY